MQKYEIKNGVGIFPVEMPVEKEEIVNKEKVNKNH